MTHENMHPSSSSGESENRPELLGHGDVGLQARLLIGDFTSPRLTLSKQKLQPIAKRGAHGITHQTADIYQRASMTQRRRHQRETGLTLLQWREGFDSYLGKIRQDTTNSARKEFLESIGVTDAQAFYDKYLGRESDVIKFVDDIERVATREQIENNQDIIGNLGNAFGYESSKVIDHLIHGVRNVKTDINAFINQGRKTVNTPEVLGNTLLQKTAEDSEVIKEPDVEPLVRRTRPAKATPTPVRRINIDEEEEEVSPAKPAARQKGGQIFPAPVEEEEHEEEGVHLITQRELDATIRLLYGDVYRQDVGREAALLRTTERVNYYGRELYAMMREYGQDFVLEKASNAVHLLQQYLNRLGLKADKRSKSQSWYLWGIAKSRFLANNSGVRQSLPNADKYEPADPLLHYREGTQSQEGQASQTAENELIEGMLGWEVYRQRKKLGTILLHLDPMMHQQDKRRLQALLAETPKPEEPQTLSSYKLREIGRIVRSNMQKK